MPTHPAGDPAFPYEWNDLWGEPIHRTPGEAASIAIKFLDQNSWGEGDDARERLVIGLSGTLMLLTTRYGTRGSTPLTRAAVTATRARGPLKIRNNSVVLLKLNRYKLGTCLAATVLISCRNTCTSVDDCYNEVVAGESEQKISGGSAAVVGRYTDNGHPVSVGVRLMNLDYAKFGTAPAKTLWLYVPEPLNHLFASIRIQLEPRPNGVSKRGLQLHIDRRNGGTFPCPAYATATARLPETRSGLGEYQKSSRYRESANTIPQL